MRRMLRTQMTDFFFSGDTARAVGDLTPETVQS